MLFCHQLASTPTPETSVTFAGPTIFLYPIWHTIKSEGSDLESEPDDNQDTTPVAILCHEETNYE